jgi:hypothetical protein
MELGDPIYVVEPHSDDAFLSLGWTMRTWIGEGRHVEVVTVHSREADRAAEAQAFAQAIGATWRGLDHPATALNRLYQPDGLPPLPDPLLPEECRDPGATRVWPLGLEHPEHVAVADRGGADPRYIDVPYQFNGRRQAEIDACLRGRVLEHWLSPSSRKWDDSAHFASQAGLFQLYPVASLAHVPEIIVGPPITPVRAG